GGRRLVALPARRLPPGTGLGSGCSQFSLCAGGGFAGRLFRLRPGRPHTRRAAAGADGRLPLPGSGLALRGSRLADLPPSLLRGWRVCSAAADGRRRFGAPAGSPPSRPYRRTMPLVAAPLPPRRILASPASHPLLPLALFRWSVALSYYPALRLMRRTLILFVRAPLLGRGKRRLAREIGDLAALRFERSMIALLLRRLGKDGRWRLRIAVTPGQACRRARHWCIGVE